MEEDCEGGFRIFLASLNSVFARVIPCQWHERKCYKSVVLLSYPIQQVRTPPTVRGLLAGSFPKTWKRIRAA